MYIIYEATGRRITPLSHCNTEAEATAYLQNEANLFGNECKWLDGHTIRLPDWIPGEETIVTYGKEM